MGKRILVVDDDTDILDLLEYNLEKEGFEVKTLDDSNEALAVAKRYNPDLIVLDIMMPSPNGIELCRSFRKRDLFKDTYIFFLTARSEFYFQEAAFDTGGDDFIEKIMGMRSLTDKINTVLVKKYVIRKSVQEISHGSFCVNRRKSTARVGAKEHNLSKPELELLFFMAQNPGKSISTDNLIKLISGSDMLSVSQSAENYIQSLTSKLGPGWLVPATGNSYRLRTD